MTQHFHSSGDFRLELKWEKDCILNFSLQAEHSDPTPTPPFMVWIRVKLWKLCIWSDQSSCFVPGYLPGRSFLFFFFPRVYSFWIVHLKVLILYLFKFLKQQHLVIVGSVMSGISFCVIFGDDCHRPHLLRKLTRHWKL